MAASSKQPFEITDFSGGITDNVFSGQMTTAFTLDNFFVTPERKLLSRPGSLLDDAAHSPIPAGNQRIGALINYARNDKLLVQSGTAVYYRSGAGVGTWSTLTGPSGNSALTAGTTASFLSTGEWNKQVFIVNDAFAHPMKIYKDGAGVYQLRNVGLPALASSPTITVGAASTRTYVYAFVMSYTYTVWTQTFLELGPTLWVTVPLSIEPGATPNLISAIPVLTNAGGNNYDTASVKIDIYRTINNGVNFYKIGSVTNGTTTFTDSYPDLSIQTNAPLYINDGTLDYYPAPSAKFVHITGNTGIYGYTKDTTGEHPYRIQQSVPGNPGFVPLITWVEVEDEIKGISSVHNLPIVLGKRIVYRIDGLFDSQGRGGMNPVQIHHSAGCISNASCVEADNWLFWAGNDGFYATDGYQVLKISDHLNSRYAAMVASSNTSRIQGKFDETNRRVIWCAELSASSLENDALFVLDLRYGVTPNSTFTTCSGTSFRPSAVEIFNGYMYRGDNNGFVFKHDPAVFTDPKVQTSVASDLWAQETIIWKLVTGHYNFGSSFFRKIVTRILLQAANFGNTTIQITATNDQGKKTRPLKIIRWRRNFTWRDETLTWRNTDCVWESEGLIEQWRRFPAGGLRLSYLQLTITNGLGIVATSASDGKCAINKASKTAVLSSIHWPSQSVDYFLHLANDNYTRSFQVTAINGSLDTITVLDASGFLPPDGAYDWELFGYAKAEPLSLLGFNLHWDNVDQNQGTFHTGDDGAN